MFLEPSKKKMPLLGKGLAGGDDDNVKLESYIEFLGKGLSTFIIEKE